MKIPSKERARMAAIYLSKEQTANVICAFIDVVNADPDPRWIENPEEYYAVRDMLVKLLPLCDK